MEVSPTPEILRIPLPSICLMLKAMGVDDIFEFRFLDMPNAMLIARALENLYAIEALDREGRLTDPLGYELAAMPVEPAYGKVDETGEMARPTMQRLVASSSSSSSSSSSFLSLREKKKKINTNNILNNASEACSLPRPWSMLQEEEEKEKEEMEAIEEALTNSASADRYRNVNGGESGTGQVKRRTAVTSPISTLVLKRFPWSYGMRSPS